MGAPIIDDELWALIEPLLPPPKPRRKKYGSVAIRRSVILKGSVAIRNGWCKNVYMYRITYANKELNC